MSQSDDNSDLEAQIKEALARRRPAPPPPPAPRVVLTPGPVHSGQPASPQTTGPEPAAQRPAGMVPDPETRLSQPPRGDAPSRPQHRPQPQPAHPTRAASPDMDPEPAIPPSPGQVLGRIDPVQKPVGPPSKQQPHPFFAGRRHLWPLLILPIVSGAIIVLLFWFLNSELGGQGVGDLAPLVEADTTPIKVPPLEEGGMEIPDQEREIFNTLDASSGSDPAVEQLVPPPEEPVVPAAPEPAADAPAVALDANGLPVVEAPDPADVAAATEATGATSADETDTAAVAAALAAAAASAATEPAGETAAEAPAEPAGEAAVDSGVETAALPAGSYRVQLAAVRSEADARTTWAQLQQKLPELLGGLSLHVEQIDLGGDKGIFYRVQAAPLADRSSAQALCGNLASRGQDCLVVQP
jgi:hypothetical protein